MPIVGFTDADGRRLLWDAVLRGEGRFVNGSDQPIPYPVVAACARGYRGSDHYGDERAVSVTTIIAPPQQKILELRHDLFVKPLDNLWAVFGTIGHGLFEQNPGEGTMMERRLVAEFEGVQLGGTFDLLVPTEGGWAGWDYKITSGYGVKKMVAEGVYDGHPEYFWQGNLYAWMAARAGTQQLVDGKLTDWDPVRITDWNICAVVRDYSARMHATINPIEVIPVPLIAASRVENYLRQRVMVWKAAQLADDPGLPHCTPEETWGGRRCLDYCASASVCHQLNPGLDSTEYV